MKLRQYPAFTLLWTASTVSSFGSYITSLALQLIIVVNLQGSSGDVAWVNSARWLPYALFGLIVGVMVDRLSKPRLLILSDFLRGVVLTAISVLGMMGLLTVPMIMVAMLIFGSLSLLGDAAHQSYLPQLVPRGLLAKANARIEQSDAIAQTTGQLVAGALIALIRAPLAFLVDAASYFFSALSIWRIKTPELSETRTELPPSESQAGGSPADQALAGEPPGLGQQILEGLRSVYAEPRLRAFAMSTHLWFIFNAMVGVSFTVYLVDSLKLGALGIGVILTGAGVGAVLGTSVTTRVGARIGPGKTILLSGAFDVLAFILIAAQSMLGLSGAQGADAWWQLWLPLIVGQLCFGFSLGLGGAHELAYRVGVTPPRLIGRMSATMRSINRAMIVLGAPLGGLLVAWLGFSWVFWIIAAGFAVCRLWLWASGFGSASYQDQPSDSLKI
ncbi:MFS family permease [Psychromicrobium silvestre]|uniref:MFS family permease n=1 Tax=Psychromicrobium silvestre TaxID=1645614 RepID=A0A7Y9LUW9_9MICC|nr:MFS transporter [Psychromicrobium silvestre]NYE96026.1 MFS family permease [Psychromicrobium silvestre]